MLITIKNKIDSQHNWQVFSRIISELAYEFSKVRSMQKSGESEFREWLLDEWNIMLIFEDDNRTINGISLPEQTQTLLLLKWPHLFK